MRIFGAGTQNYSRNYLEDSGEKSIFAAESVTKLGL